MKSYLPLAISMSLGFSLLAPASFAGEVLEPVELELAEAPIQQTDETILPQVMVQSKKDVDEGGYQPGKTRVGKTNQLPKDIPQSVTIVPEQLMVDRNANTLKEALRNVAGLTFNAGEGGRIGDNITLRGYSAVGDLYLDGVRDMAQYNRETFNLEQVEVLRGSASMLYGRGSTGGIINQVTKTPEEDEQYKVSTTGGSFNYLRGTVDFNKKLTPHIGVRLNSMVTSDDSFRHGPEYKRWGIAPSVTFGMGTPNQLTASYYYLQEGNIPDMGVPYYKNRPLDVPVTRFYGLANADYERNKTSIATVTYEHRFKNESTLRSIVRQAYYKRDMRATAPRFRGIPSTPLLDDSIINRQRQARGGIEQTLTSQTEYNGKFKTGPFKHQLLAGFEHIEERSKRWSNVSPFANPAATVDNVDNSPRLPFGFDDSFERSNFNYYRASTNGLYTQDTIEVLPHLKVLMGTRFDNMRADYKRPMPAGPLSRRDNVWSYRGAVLYQPTELATYYVSYGSSFNPSAELYQLDDRTANTKPERNRNIEAGGKWELFGGNLSLRTAIFRSEKTNERNTDLSRPDVALLTGRRHTDGIELEAAGRLTRHWQLFGSTALMRSKVDEASVSQITALNKRPVNTPNYTFSLWSTYDFKFHGDWKIGAGIEGVGARYANANNRIDIPAYTRVDAMIEYAIKQYSLRVNLFNLCNKKYYEGIYTGHVIPGTPLAAQVTLSMKL